MSAETDTFIQKVQNVKNEFNKEGDLIKPATRYFTMQERIGREKELQELDAILNLAPGEMASINMTPQRLGLLRNRRKNLTKELQANTPPNDLSGETKDALYKLEKELIDKIQPGMLFQEEMRHAPVGAVDRNVKWMNRTKSYQLAYKNVRRLRHPDSEDADLANIEQLRPSMFAKGQPSIFMPDGQIRGHMSYSHIPDQNWEEAGLPLVNPQSPLARMEREEQQTKRKDLIQVKTENKPLEVAIENKKKRGRPKKINKLNQQESIHDK